MNMLPGMPSPDGNEPLNCAVELVADQVGDGGRALLMMMR